MDIEIVVKGEAAKAIETLRRITGKKKPVEVVVAALRIYEWILAQQTLGNNIVSKDLAGSAMWGVELADLVRDRELAAAFFKGRDIFK